MIFKVKIQRGTGGYLLPYIEKEGKMFRYASGHCRSVKFRCYETGEEIKGLVYPFYPHVYTEGYKVHIKGGEKDRY